MGARSSLALACLAGGGVAIGGFGADAEAQCADPTTGPDVIVGDITSPAANYAAQNTGGSPPVYYDAFSLGTTACNIGDAPLQWYQYPSNYHPAIGQGLYKLKGGRIEQIGMSWLKHGFAAVAEDLCCQCNDPGGTYLPAGCSDPYTAARNGAQSGLGPRWQVNADTGYFPGGTPADPGYSGTTVRRLRVRSAELEPSSASVRYYGEAQYVTQDDAAASNQNNNASYRPVTITGGPNEFSLGMSGATQRTKPAIRAWKALHPDVVETDIQLPDEGLLILAARATDLGGGQWHYEYALHNLNSDRSARGVTVPLPPGVTLSNIGFHDVEYHGGDSVGNYVDGSANFSGQDWAVTQSSDSINWSTETFEANINANALRWGTMYNFRFDADIAPGGGRLTIETFKQAGSVSASSIVPGGTPLCPEDLTGDGQVNVADLLAVIGAWGGPKGDVNADGATNVQDLLLIIGAWGPC